MHAAEHAAVLQSTLVLQLCHSVRVHTQIRRHTHVCYSARCDSTDQFVCKQLIQLCGSLRFGLNDTHAMF